MRRKYFYRSHIDKKKSEIKALIEENSSDSTSRLDFIVKRLNQLRTEEETSEFRLETIIYIMSALVHHQKYGGLTKATIKKFVEYAEAVFISENIVAGESRLSFLFVELYAVLSQIDTIDGDHWPSTWKLMSAFHFQHRPTDQEMAWKSLGLAIRFLRLGHCSKALDYYRKCDFQFGEEHFSYQSKIGQVICHKLLRHDEEMKQNIDILYSQGDDLPSEVDLDLQWELATWETFRDGNPSRLFKMVNKRKDGHNFPSYQLEAYYWSKLKRPFTQSPVSKPSTISRNNKMNRRSFRKFYQASCLLEKALDQDYPLSQRLRYLGEMTEYSSEVRTLDRELLILATTVVWLRHNSFNEIAEISCENYRARCLYISGGDSGDLLNIFDEKDEKQNLYKVVS